jgi:PadR family transcriptional regulator, regulatory protein PadR
MPKQQQPELLQGTLEVMLLKTLKRSSNHGYGLARAIELSSGKALAIEEGSLYPALYRLEKRGDIQAEWRTTENNRRAKFYSLTTRGRKRLDEQVALWERLSNAVAMVLADETPAGGGGV